MELEMDALAQVVSMLKLTTEDVPISWETMVAGIFQNKISNLCQLLADINIALNVIQATII
jgi:hypothetical protein